MPEILRMFGPRFYFYSREHEPILTIAKWKEYFGTSIEGGENED